MSQVPMYPPIATLLRSAILYAVSGGTQGVPDVGTSGSFTARQLVDVLKVTDTWNMTQTFIDTVPNVSYSIEAFPSGAPHNWTMTPAGGASQVKLVGGALVSSFPSAARSARIAVTAASPANLPLSGLVFANGEASAADVVSAMFSGYPVGTCTHVASAYIDSAGITSGGPMKVRVNYISAGQNHSEIVVASGGIVAADEVYVSLLPSGKIVVNVNDTSDVTSVGAINVIGMESVRAMVFGYYAAAAAPVGTISFDLSNNTSGRVGFSSAVDPAAPAGSRDGDRFLVSVAGGFGGKKTSVFDVVELRNSKTEIIVTRSHALTDDDVNWLISKYLEDNPPQFTVPLIDAARARANVMTMVDDPALSAYPPSARGDAVMVGTAPAGAFATFPAYSLAVWDGVSAYQYFTAPDFIGVEFALHDPLFESNTMRHLAPGSLTGYDVGGSIFGIPVQNFVGNGWMFRKVANLGRPTTAQAINFLPGSTAMAVLGTSERFAFACNGDGVFTVDFAGSGIGYVVISHTNGGGDVATVSVTGLGYSLRFDDDNTNPVEMIVDNGAIVSIRRVGESAWISGAALLAGAWVDVGGGEPVLEYRRVGDIVYVRGSVVGGVSNLVLTMAQGYRPAVKQFVQATVISTGNVVDSRAWVETDGDLIFSHPVGFGGFDRIDLNFSFAVI